MALTRQQVRKENLALRLAELERTNEELREEFKNRLIAVVTTAVGVVAALFWQTAITDTIKTFIPVSGAWYYEIGVAFAVTIIAAGILYWLSRRPSNKAAK